MSMRADIDHVLVDEEQINAINKKLGEQISNDYKGKNLLLVSILKGAVVFLSDFRKFCLIIAYKAGFFKVG